MGFGWLKSLGKAVVKGAKAATPFATAVAAVVPSGSAVAGIVDAFTLGSQIVAQTEMGFAMLFGPDAKKGADKLKFALPSIIQAVWQSAAMAGKTIENQSEFEAGCSDFASALVRIHNSVKAPVLVP